MVFFYSIKNEVEEGAELSYKLIGEKIDEKMKIILLLNPDRSFGRYSQLETGYKLNKLTKNWIMRFSIRNGFEEKIKQMIYDKKKSRLNFHCDLCEKKFTLKSSLVLHRRNLHLL